MNELNQKGFGHLVIPIVIVVFAVVGFAGYKVLKANNKSKDSQTSSSDWKFTTFDDCVKHYTPITGDQGKVNDTCTNLQNSQPKAQEAAQTCTPAPAVANAKDAFTALPFDTSNIRLITNGKETNDARFVYPWVKSGKVNIYAPADGVLFKIRHKVFEVGGLKGNDYDIFFQVDCGTAYRFNHITDPRDNIKATYPAGDLASGDYSNGGQDMPERVKPKIAIKVKAGELLGSTSGTPEAQNFDFAVGVASEAPKSGELKSVCPFNVFSEPNKTKLLALMGPKNGDPTPGYACNVPSQKF